MRPFHFKALGEKIAVRVLLCLTVFVEGLDVRERVGPLRVVLLFCWVTLLEVVSE